MDNASALDALRMLRDLFEVRIAFRLLFRPGWALVSEDAQKRAGKCWGNQEQYRKLAAEIMQAQTALLQSGFPVPDAWVTTKRQTPEDDSLPEILDEMELEIVKLERGATCDGQAGQNGANRATVPSNGATAADDDDAYVNAAKLWPTKFTRYEDCRAFLATSSIRTKGKGQRRLIHAADWANHWAAVDKAAFEALENYEGEPIIPVIVDAEQLAETARERYRKTAARVRKK